MEVHQDTSKIEINLDQEYVKVRDIDGKSDDVVCVDVEEKIDESEKDLSEKNESIKAQ